jgi:anti-anti-sigma regulatory factor
MPTGTVFLDLASLRDVDVSAVDALARLRLAARRTGLELRLRHVAPQLLELLDFCGLAEALRVESSGQPEERKEPGGVEEERQLRDPPT